MMAGLKSKVQSRGACKVSSVENGRRLRPHDSHFRVLTLQRCTAFTLLELMIVVSIMGIVMTMGIPLVYNFKHKQPMRKAISDVVQICSNARARAIMQGAVTEVVFYPLDRRLEVTASAAASTRSDTDSAVPAEAPTPPPSGSGLSAQLSEDVVIEMLDVNLTEYKDLETARVRFYPNGTCDEMTLILRSLAARSPRDEWAAIWLEVTTGLASVETDRSKFNTIGR